MLAARGVASVVCAQHAQRCAGTQGTTVICDYACMVERFWWMTDCGSAVGWLRRRTERNVVRERGD